MSLGSSLVRRATSTKVFRELRGWGGRIHAETPIAFFAIVLAVAFAFRLGVGFLKKTPAEEAEAEPPATTAETESSSAGPTAQTARSPIEPVPRPASGASPSIRRDDEKLPPDTITPRAGIPKRKPRKAKAN